MSTEMSFRFVFGVAACATVMHSGASAAPVDFLTTNPIAEVRAEARVGSMEDLSGGPFTGFTGGLSVSFAAGIDIDKSTGSEAFASLDVDFTTNTIVASGGGGGDADSEGPLASSYTLAFFDLLFTLDESAPVRFATASAGGTHADASIVLAKANNDIVIDSFGTFGEIDGWEGVLPAGDYRLSAAAGASINTNDGFNGLFGGSNFFFEFIVLPAPGAAALFGLGGLIAARRRR